MSIIILAVAPLGSAGPDEAMLMQFESLMLALDLGKLDRVGWDRLRGILAQAMAEAKDPEQGLSAYLQMIPKWKRCDEYDGKP